MKKFILCLALLIVGTFAKAQKVKLVKGQKLTYELLERNSYLHSIEIKSLNLSTYQFEVLGWKKGVYNIKMQSGRKLSYYSHNGRIEDSNVPSTPTSTISNVINDVLSKNPVFFDMDTAGKVTAIRGLDSIVAKIKRQAIKQQVPENRYGDPNEKFIKYATLPESFIRKIGYAFNRRTAPKIDTVFRKFEPGKVDALITLKKETVVDISSGLTNFFYMDSIAQGTVPIKGTKQSDRYGWWFSLKSSNIAGFKSTMDLFSEFANETNLKAYQTPQKKAVRDAIDLYEWYGESKGKVDLEEVARKKLDSLSKLVDPNDLEFNAAAIQVLSWFDYEAKMKLIEKVPLEYLRTDADVASKATKAYEQRNTEKFTEALKVMFTKFAASGDYPSNVAHVAYVANFTIAEDIRNPKTSRAELLKIQEMVNGALKLNLPKLSDVFDGVAVYLRATLASTPKEVETLADERFSSVFDNYGRYRLLIYDRMKTLKVPDSISNAYLDYSMEMFRDGIADASKPFEGESMDRYHFESRVQPLQFLLRKQLADAYYRKSLMEPKHATRYLQLASDYLPTQDQLIGNKYIVSDEYPFLPERNYTELYINSAGATGMSPEEMLKKYVDMVIVEPDRYTILKEKYVKAFPQGDFNVFFRQALKDKLPASPKFNLKERGGLEVNNATGNGKYVFIDFWGTWCGACVAEIDKIEDLHVNNPVPDKLMVTTIACYDKKNLVDDFMEKKKFSYQVLMSDDKVEKQFKIASYPTKLLLLPNDVYLMIPTSMDYKAAVKKYMNWEL
ncbi:MAG: TlpA disulfide reductase family protein [Pedobacter sp.]